MSRTIFVTSLQVLEPAVAEILNLCLELVGRRSAAYGYIVVGYIGFVAEVPRLTNCMREF